MVTCTTQENQKKKTMTSPKPFKDVRSGIEEDNNLAGCFLIAVLSLLVWTVLLFFLTH